MRLSVTPRADTRARRATIRRGYPTNRLDSLQAVASPRTRRGSRARPTLDRPMATPGVNPAQRSVVLIEQGMHRLSLSLGESDGRDPLSRRSGAGVRQARSPSRRTPSTASRLR